MAMTKILTLCEDCAKLMDGAYRIKSVVGKTTTEKKTACEQCGSRLSKFSLRQYLVTSRREK